ncbi:hypothetical protein [uncultured Cohaesibacter sp.]|uniref:hypothetical protein n=1 Tax=uncultured Cohaesibacter sp. TaxID=1002546 RepID=UPI0029C95CF8|nr:hypothetical protein [uncultured Cohaesibacter sp.]
MFNTIMVPVDLRRSSKGLKALTIAAKLARANDIKKSAARTNRLVAVPCVQFAS